LAGVADLPIESLEEPLAEPDFTILKQLQDQTPFSLALDESLWRMGPEAVFSSCPTKRVVLKPMAAGGPASTYRLGRLAQEAGLETVVTTTIDGRIGTWAAIHAAAALDEQKKWTHGLSTGAWIKENNDLLPSDSAEISAF